MQALFDKMKEYLNMDSEISFDEFDRYYKEVLDFLGTDWDKLNEEESMQMLFILDNLKSNADDRMKRRLKEAKKYKKIVDRTNIWISAMLKRLHDMGLNDEEISKRYEAIYEAV